MDALKSEGTARDALAVRDFRRVYWSSFASNIGRWMQNVALGVLAFEQTDDAAFTTLVISVQMFPLLILSVVGGSLADSVDRRILLIATQSWQVLFSLVLAWHVWDGTFNESTLLFIVFMTGLGQALFAPAFNAILPSLVGRENLSAAISLNSAQMNGSRVIGPVIGSFLISSIGIGAVFALNALTYLIVIGALFTVAVPALEPLTASMKDRLLGGFRIAKRSVQVGRSLSIMTTFSLLCLPFIGLMPVIAERSLGVDAKSTTFGFLYGAFGMGALTGAISVGTILVNVPKEKIVRYSLGLFGLALAVFATLRSPTPAFPVLYLVGLFYFTMPTALSTFLQLHLGDEVRGRVMALWIISFGGTVAITNFASGALVELTSLTAVLMVGAVVAVLMAIFVRIESGPMATKALLGE